MEWILAICAVGILFVFLSGKRRLFAASKKGTNSRKASDVAEDSGNVFVCYFNPTKPTYRTAIKGEVLTITKNEVPVYYADGRLWDDVSTQWLVANTPEELREYAATIIEKKIYNPSYPRSVRFVWTGLPDKIVTLKGDVVLSKDISDISKAYPTYHRGWAITYNRMHGETAFESKEHYDERMAKKKLEDEEKRCQNLVSLLDHVEIVGDDGKATAEVDSVAMECPECGAVSNVPLSNHAWLCEYCGVITSIS